MPIIGHPLGAGYHPVMITKKEQRISRNILWDEVACQCGCGMGDPLKTPPRILENIFNLAHEVQILTNILSLNYSEHIIVVLFNSWCRCPSHNAAEGGVKNSVHLTGGATDARFFRRVGKSRIPINPRIVCRLAYKLTEYSITRFGGIGRYPNRTHLDIRKKPRVFWRKDNSGYTYGVNFQEI